MPNVLDAAVVRKKLASYLARKTSLKAFHAWLIPATWDVEETASGATRELVYEILLCFAEYTSGHLTDADLRKALLPLATSFRDSFAPQGSVSFVSLPRTEPRDTRPTFLPSSRRSVRIHRLVSSSGTQSLAARV